MAINKDVFAGWTAGDRMSDLELIATGESEERLVSIYDIDEHPENRAINYEVVHTLAQDIEKDGLAQWPLVRISPDDKGRYQHIAGWHRILAYRELYERTHDSKYEKINVIVRLDCDDDTALRLVWSTNMDSSNLSLEEFGKGALVLGRYVDQLRQDNPEEYKGVRTAEVVAQMISTPSKPVSKSKVARAMKAAKEAEKTDKPKAEQKKTKTDKPNELQSILNGLDRALTRLDKYLDTGGTVSVMELSYRRKQLKDIERRVGDENEQE